MKDGLGAALGARRLETEANELVARSDVALVVLVRLCSVLTVLTVTVAARRLRVGGPRGGGPGLSRRRAGLQVSGVRLLRRRRVRRVRVCRSGAFTVIITSLLVCGQMRIPRVRLLLLLSIIGLQ